MLESKLELIQSQLKATEQEKEELQCSLDQTKQSILDVNKEVAIKLWDKKQQMEIQYVRKFEEILGCTLEVDGKQGLHIVAKLVDDEMKLKRDLESQLMVNTDKNKMLESKIELIQSQMKEKEQEKEQL